MPVGSGRFTELKVTSPVGEVTGNSVWVHPDQIAVMEGQVGTGGPYTVIKFAFGGQTLYVEETPEVINQKAEGGRRG